MPAFTPVTTPAEFTMAIEVLEDVQIPPGVASLKIIGEFTHTEALPVTGATANGISTVIGNVLTEMPQVFVVAYEMVAVPGAIPVTKPEPLTVAIPGAPLLHEPPETGAVSKAEEDLQTAGGPVMVPKAGSAPTVTVLVADVAPQAFARV